MMIYLSDHKAETLTGVVAALEQFNEDWPSDDIELLEVSLPGVFGTDLS